MKDKVLWIILIFGLVFRLINFESSFFFAHDQDLYSWIAKDIVINHHLRLVGQLTSVDGVFIGSFYYYLMAAFYYVFKMNPLSAVIPLTIIGVFSIWSIYWVVSKNFSKRSGLVAAFIYAVSLGVVSFDRWSVPTQPTLIWSIWFLAVILGLGKGNLRYLPLYGFLCGFVWQLHIALLPILLIPIIAYIVGGHKINLLWDKKNVRIVLASVSIFVLTMSPFLMFELKHNFLQVKSMAVGISKNTGGLSGMNKLVKVIDASGREFQQRFWIGDFVSFSELFWIFLIVMATLLVIYKKIDLRILSMFVLWYLLIMLAQFSSKRVVSEYYFTNLVPIYILISALFIDSFVGKKVMYFLAGLYFGVNGWWLLTKSDYDQSYRYRRELVEFVKNDSMVNKFPCIAVNFISDPGVGVGFRYLFWYYGVDLVKPGTPGVPVYNVPIPWQLSVSESPKQFGRFGLLMPVKTKSLINKPDCHKLEYQLDPLLGYTE